MLTCRFEDSKKTDSAQRQALNTGGSGVLCVV